VQQHFFEFCENTLDLLQQATIRTNTDVSALVQVLAWFDQFNHPIIPEDTWLQCQLALAEGFTNAVRHAHSGKPAETPIDIEVKVLKQGLEIRIWDSGAGFDLNQTLNMLPPLPEQTAIGGRGLKLMQHIADHLSYTPTDDQRNCLLIAKHYNHL
jgi:serine/threonine-protein kinase RsbW